VPYNTSGVVDGTTTNANANSKQTSVFKIAAAWEPMEGLVLTPSVYYQEVKQNNPSIFWVSPSAPSHDEFRNGDVLSQPSDDKWVLPSFKVTANLSWAALTSDTAYFHRGAYANNDYTNFLLDILFVNPYPPAGVNSPSRSTDSQDNFSEEFRLQSLDQSARFTWLVGAFYSDAHQGATQNATLNDAAFPVHDIFIGSMLLVDKQLAGFVNLDYKFTDTLSVTAGARVAHDKLDFQESQSGLVVGAAPPYSTGTQSDTPVTPKVVLSDQIDADNLVYASAGKGYRMGGVNGPVGTSCGVTAPQTFDPDTLWSYELGYKSRLFSNRLAIDASVFYIDWKGIQQTLTLTCGFSTTLNLGAAVSKGFDLSLQYLVTPEFQVSEALGYTDAYYSEAVAGPGIPGVLVSKGDTLGVAPWTSTLVARYEFPAFKGSHIYVRPEWIYHSHNSGISQRQDSQAVDFYDPTSPLNPATNLFNLRAGATFDKFDVSLFVNNLTNSHPLLSLTHYNANNPIYEATTFRPLTAGITAIVRY
jgi:outer membrane receptor protein involved in Fe transport